MPRPRTHDEALRRRLLELAGQELSAHGPDDLSLRKLADSAGTTTRAIYSLFGSKPELLDAVVDEAFTRFAAHLRQVETTEDPREEIRMLGHAYRASALADPHFYPIMFGTAGSNMRPSPETQQRAGETFEPLRRRVERAIEHGVFRPEGSLRIAAALWGVVHGLVSLELGGYLHTDAPTDVFDSAIRATLIGWSCAS